MKPTRIDQPLEAIRDLAVEHSVAVTYAKGFCIDGREDAALVENAIDVARRADVAVIFAGLSEQIESEGIDRPNIDLPAAQVALIRAVADVAHRTVVVLSNGGVVSLEGWHDDVDAILDGFLLGQGGGHAIAEILFGRINPSGHLAETIPLRLQDHPSSLNFPGEQGHVRYGEGVMVGYRYFSTFETPVRYPFGHGLSYTTFRTDQLAISMIGDDEVMVSVEVTNTGAVTGKHVVQIYVATECGPVQRPVRELRGFEKVELAAGQATSVHVRLPRRAFAYWDILQERWVVAPGEYRIQVGADATTVLHEVAVVLAGDTIINELTLDTPMGEWFSHPHVGERVLDTLGFTGSAVSEEQMAMMASMTMRQFLNISGLPIPADVLDELMLASRP